MINKKDKPTKGLNLKGVRHYRRRTVQFKKALEFLIILHRQRTYKFFTSKEIAEKMNISKRNAREYLKDAEELGLLRLEYTGDGISGSKFYGTLLRKLI